MVSWSLPEGIEPLAKPNQTYRQHVQRVLEAHIELWPQTEDYWRHLGELLIKHKLFSENIEFFLKRIEAGLRIACCTHDIGKLNEGFYLYMNAIRRRNEGEKVHINPEWHFRHELLSLPYTFHFSKLLDKCLGSLPSKLPWETVAVMAHHKRLDNDIFQRERKRSFIPPFPMLEPMRLRQEAWEWLDKYFSPELKMLKQLPKKFWEESLHLLYTGKVSSFIPLKNKICDTILTQKKIEAKFLLRFLGASVRAHLQICDWWASADKHEIFGFGKSSASPFQPLHEAEDWLKERLEKTKRQSLKEKSVEIEWRPFQKDVANANNYTICIAPTGSGKTEAALLWALNQIKNNTHISKIIYLLPTTTTANAIHTRLRYLFGNAFVGVAHSRARLLREDEEEESEEDRGDVRQSVLFESVFMPPIIVATLDQLLLAGQHGKYWVFRDYSLAQSAVILDELHTFDPYTLGLLGAYSQQCRLLDVPVLALSATFPEPLQRLFQQWFEDVDIVKDVTLLNASRGEWQYFPDITFEDTPFLEKIAWRMRQGERFLIVRNTVRGAQETYENLRRLEAPVQLLHSQFIHQHRKEIEDAVINSDSVNGISLVATQIIEVSLDVDYDHLITELCPPDALVQRAGRCNRARKKTGSTITVLAADEVSHKVYQEKFGLSTILQISANTLSQLLSTPKPLTEQDLLNWVNDVYRDIELVDNEKYLEGERDLLQMQRARGYILDHPTEDEKLKTRWITEERVPVIPLTIWESSDEHFKEQFFNNPVLRQKYVVEIPFWRRKQLYIQGNAMPLEYQGRQLPFLYWVDVPYD
ncbi:MAG: CRISPR-associated helicase Cas3', partial [Calditrichaeota bacterium]